MVKIAPSLLAAKFGELTEEIMRVEAAGADLLHVDVMDGHFVPNITIGPPVVAALNRAARAPLDVHLMIADPDRYLEAFVKAGADYLSVHYEACTHLHRTVGCIRELGVKAGVALNPATPLAALEEILPNLDFVLLMSVNPGFTGQKFIPESLDKVRRLKKTLRERRLNNVEIEVDGGVTLENAASLINAGVDILVAGAAVFWAKDYGQAIRAIRKSARPQGKTSRKRG